MRNTTIAMALAATFLTVPAAQAREAGERTAPDGVVVAADFGSGSSRGRNATMRGAPDRDQKTRIGVYRDERTEKGRNDARD